MVKEHDSRPPQPTHEMTDARMKPILALAVILIVFSVTAFLVTWAMFDALEEREAAVDRFPSPLADPNPVPPAPRLQQTPQLELDEYREKTHRQLESYQWIDKDGQVLRIPVERAMDLLLERGIAPVAPTPEPASP